MDREQTQRNKTNGITASTLKLVAIITMIIDHFGFALYYHMPQFQYTWYKALRLIGRLSFPIFCFLLVEGFWHTRNVKKYLVRLFLFALLSEIPFDFAFFQSVWFPQAQNVFFTLAIGLLTIWILNCLHGVTVKAIVGQGCVILLAMIAGWALRVDYGAFGVFYIVLLYYAGTFGKRQLEILGAIGICKEITAPLSFVLIHFYNGERGISLKYLFYLVYPLHLLIFGLIRMFVIKA